MKLKNVSRNPHFMNFAKDSKQPKPGKVMPGQEVDVPEEHAAQLVSSLDFVPVGEMKPKAPEAPKTPPKAKEPPKDDAPPKV